jgi:hypothetical protein
MPLRLLSVGDCGETRLPPRAGSVRISPFSLHARSNVAWVRPARSRRVHASDRPRSRMPRSATADPYRCGLRNY